MLKLKPVLENLFLWHRVASHKTLSTVKLFLDKTFYVRNRVNGKLGTGKVEDVRPIFVIGVQHPEAVEITFHLAE
jgi:hypothetical protein